MGNFSVKKITKINSLKLGDIVEESDLTVQNDKYLIQFNYVAGEEKRDKVVIKTGSYSIVKTMAGIDLAPITLSEVKLLDDINNTAIITSEGDKFFNRLEIYQKYGRDPKRSILLYSSPGIGKTSSINQICRKYIAQEGTAVIIWDTSSIESSNVKDFFVQNSEFDSSVKRLILVIEDIDGGSIESDSSYREAKSSLLNLLDGIGRPFQGIPTFIIATTNDPERSVKALIDRPGRFDKVIELLPPNESDCLRLLKFIGNVEENEELLEVAHLAAKNQFSIAHLHEIIVRSDIDEITLTESVKQLIAHKTKVKNNFVIKSSMGLK
jgi:replication-associated recombination protein RarA